MKLNHMICPNCGHDFYTDCAYGRCDACQCTFYAANSRTSNSSMQPKPSGNITVNGEPIADWIKRVAR